jgi:hypothetical protein
LYIKANALEKSWGKIKAIYKEKEYLVRFITVIYQQEMMV